ncbi:MAG: hypothetical protein ACJ74U_06930 [Jatrophihabitantaceae bacterium]
MSALSDYLNAHVPAGWSKPDVIRALAGDLDRTTVYRYLAGNHSRTPPEYVLDAFAKALPGCSLVELREAAGAAVGEEEAWTPPMEANRLNRGQRSALEAFIRATVQADTPPAGAAGSEQTGGTQQQVRAYVAQLRQTGQAELADRLEASFEITSSASQTASRSSTD